MTSRDVDYCPNCTDTHNPWMSCETARRLRVQARPGWCTRCEHEHSTEALAGICIGCACQWRPAGTTPPADPGPVRSLGECRTLPMFSNLDAE